ncbi:25816_t:CDS:2, partial [Dentiscutata erythropus]
ITSQKNGLRASANVLKCDITLKKTSSKNVASEVATLPPLPQILQKFVDLDSKVALLDLHPYSQIMEARMGNGSLTLYLARSLYPTGYLHSININCDASIKAHGNVARFSRGIYSDYVLFSIGQCSK